jgi:hypothetical protein
MRDVLAANGVQLGGNGTRATNGRHASEQEKAAEWLRGYLADGAQPEQLVRHDGEHAGYSWATLLGAKDHLQIRATDEGIARYWRLPSFGRWERSPGMEDEDDDDRPF